MRYLILSDVHSNLVALEAVLAAAGSFDAVWCLGDTVGYGPRPNECAERIRELPGLRCVAGNHDWGAIGRLDLGNFNREARLAAEWTGRQLTPANRAWLEGLPECSMPRRGHANCVHDVRERHEQCSEAAGFTLVHGSPRHPIWEYLLSPETAQENWAYFNTLTCLVGHTHVPVIFREPGLRHTTSQEIVPELDQPFSYRAMRTIINPGSIGQPRDGDPRASLLLLDTDAQTVTYRRVPYAIEQTQAQMEATGLPARLALRLSYGV